MDPILRIAINAARSAGDIIARSIDRLESIQVQEKKTNDLVTNIDYQAEQTIIQIIRKSYPDHAILSEESGEHPGNEYIWIIDPLDGTNNFVHGFPHLAVSIALKHKDQLQCGVIYDPIRQELFTSLKGRGAYLNQYRLHVSHTKDFAGAIIGIATPDLCAPILKNYLATLHALCLVKASLRRAASAALDLAYIAAGRLDGVWECSLKPWDIGAGALLIQEAGGLITDFGKKENYWDTGNIIAANPKMHALLLKLLDPFIKSLELKTEES